MTNSSPSFLLVDGNNIIHAWPELLELHQRRKASARAALIQILESYQDFSDDRVVVVFDGRGGKVSEERAPGSIQIFYSSTDSTADAIIERLAAGNANQFRITVATDDVAIQDSVVAAGGEALSSRGLQSLIEQGEREMRRWLKRK